MLRRVGQEIRDRYAFTHTLVRDAIYGELLRGRRCATTTGSPSPRSGPTPTTWIPTSTSWPTTSTWAPPWRTRTRPALLPGRGRARLRLLAFEEAAAHFARSLEVAEQFGPSATRGSL